LNFASSTISIFVFYSYFLFPFLLFLPENLPAPGKMWIFTVHIDKQHGYSQSAFATCSLYQIFPYISRKQFSVISYSKKIQKLFIPSFFVPDSGVYWI